VPKEQATRVYKWSGSEPLYILNPRTRWNRAARIVFHLLERLSPQHIGWRININMDVIVKKNSRPLLRIKLQPSSLESVTFLTELFSRTSNISLHSDKHYDLYARIMKWLFNLIS
jgi:hypothetical protein